MNEVLLFRYTVNKKRVSKISTILVDVAHGPLGLDIRQLTKS